MGFDLVFSCQYVVEFEVFDNVVNDQDVGQQGQIVIIGDGQGYVGVMVGILFVGLVVDQQE